MDVGKSQINKLLKFINLASVMRWFYATLREFPASTASASPFSMVMYLPLTASMPLFWKRPSRRADGSNGQAQVVTNIATRHGQAELTRGETTLGETAGEVIDKRSQSLFCILFGKQQIMS